jgi:hypothetical protein
LCIKKAAISHKFDGCFFIFYIKTLNNMLDMFLGEPLRLASRASRRAIRSITFAHFISFMRYGGSATIPLAKPYP